MSSDIKFAVGGAVQNKQGTYLKRPADDALFAACQAGEFSYVLACRQIGKSSLMIETADRLIEAGIRTVWIDLNGIGQGVSVDEWYFSLIDALAERLRLKIDIQTWWETRPDLSAVPARFLQFFRDIVLEEIDEQIVIFIDEIDVTLGLPFTDDFFAAIRTIYTERMREPAFERLTFALLGVATPDELIKDYNRTPFNIGQAIHLRDFTEAECEPFQQKIEAAYPIQGTDYFEQIYAWTNGHPYLTQRLCQEILNTGQDEQVDLVETLVNETFLVPKARGDDNIQFVQTRVTNDPYAQNMLRLYNRILENKEPVLDDEHSPPINRLKLYGLVVAYKGQLQVRNNIYAQAFDTAWASETFKSMRLGLPTSYTILQRIDQRGFSTIYLAQTQGIDGSQLVILKVLQLPKDIEAEWIHKLDLLQQTLQTVAELEHPNIAQIFETGRVDERTLFVAMEYIAGSSLRAKLQDEPLLREEAIEIIRQIGAALSYSHQQDILHLGIHPNDIFIDSQQQPSRLALVDFGYTQLIHDASQAQPHLKHITLNPQYIAPEYEQLQSPLLDLYGLAVTFFEALAGQLPPDRQPYEPLPRLSEIVPNVGPFFDEILCKATANNPTDRFNTVADFMEAIEAANEKAEETERSERQMRAASVVAAAQGYTATGRYDPEKALNMIEAALEIYPDYPDALIIRGKIWRNQGEIDKALADYRQAHAQTQDLSSEEGFEFLEVLSEAADSAWQSQLLPQAVRYYEEMWQILEGHQGDTAITHQAWTTAHARLVEYHYRGGEIAFDLDDPEQIDERIEILEQQIEALNALEAHSESKKLQTKLHGLHVQKLEHTIATAQAAINDINSKESYVRYANDDIFEHYATLDQAYVSLIELEPENEQWLAQRRRKQREMAAARGVFAVRALNKIEPDYEASLKHYRAINDLKNNGYPSIARDLGLSLNQKIDELERIIDYDGKYQEIQRLMDAGHHEKALERLDQEFLQIGHYEHREVARMLWGLVYAKKNGGNLPPEWEGLSVVDTLSNRLVEVERKQIQLLEDNLEPWSQLNIFKTVDRESKRLQTHSEQIEGLENLLDDTVIHGLTEKTDITGCRNDLTNIKAEIQDRRSIFFQINMEDTVQKVEAWLQKLEDVKALSETDNPVKDIPEFLNRSDECQQAIKRDASFETLQTMLSASDEVQQMIDTVKLHIQERLPWFLVEDIGKKDEEITAKAQEIVDLKEVLANTKQTVDEERQKIAALQESSAVKVTRTVLIIGGVIAALANLLVVFLIWEQVTALSVAVFMLPAIIIVISGLLIFYLRRRNPSQ